MSQSTVDRREFSRALAASALGSLPLTATAATAEEKKKDPSKLPAAADLILDLVKQRYPEGLEEEHLALVRKDIESAWARSRLLSSFPLVNADEPAVVFSADRKEGG